MEEPQNILGIYYSTSSPAVCINGKDFFFINREPKYEGIYKEGDITIKGIWYGPKKSGHNQLQMFGHLTHILIQEIKHLTPGIAYIEGYSLGSKGNLTLIAENTGVMKVALAMLGWEIRIVSPMTAKKEFAGTGAAKKEQMADAWFKKLGFYVHDRVGCDKGASPASDVVDSLAMLNCKSYNLKNKRKPRRKKRNEPTQ